MTLEATKGDMATFCAMESRSSTCPVMMASFSQISRESIKPTISIDNRNRNNVKTEIKDEFIVNGNVNNNISISSSENSILKKRNLQSLKSESDENLINNSNIERDNNTRLSNDNKEYDSVYCEYKKKGASPRMLELLEGLNEPGDCGNSTDIPEWLDRDLFNKGRQFYKDWLFSLFFSDLLSLLCMFSVSRILRVLIYTRRSDTPMRALKRYVSTIMHIITWEEGDVWDANDTAYKDLQSVRSMHSKASTLVNSTKDYEKVANVPVSDKKYVNSSCPMNSEIRNDLLNQTYKHSPLENEQTPAFYISQWDMAFTQYAFFGLITAHPREMGVHYATDDEFKALVHFWRGIGYLLGIEDRYNFCNGSLKEVRKLCLETEQLIILPHLSTVEWKYEHMSRSLMEGINLMVPHLAFPAMFRYVAETLGEKMPHVINHMSFYNTIQYWLMRFTFSVIFLIPGIIRLFNNILLLALDYVLGRRKPLFGKVPVTIKL